MTAEGSLPSPAVVLALAAAAGYPPVQIHTLRLEGEDAWLEALTGHPRPVPSEVTILLEGLGAPWLTKELIATEAAWERVRRWAAAGGLAQPDTPETRRATIERVVMVGDDTLHPLVRRALERLPLPVLDHIRRHAVILPVGRSCAGFCVTETRPYDDAVEARRWLSVAYEVPARDGLFRRLLRRFQGRRGPDHDPEASFMDTVGHEAAHHTLLPAPPPRAARTVAEATKTVEDRRRHVSLAVEWGLLSHVAKPDERDERQAAALTRSWGFSGVGADGERCALNARRAVLAEAAALPPFESGT